jgi:2-haloacid dehalogenase
VRYEFILFDADGTLLDFHRSEAEAVKETMLMHGIEPLDENVRLYSGINDSLWKKLERGEIEKSVLIYHRFELLAEALGVTVDFRQMARDYENALSTKGYLIDGAKEMCQRLYGRAKMYIVTNGLEKVQRERQARCGIAKYFDGLFISGVIGIEKPSVGFFEYVKDHVDGFDKNKAIIVGDSLSSDMKGGINFGIDTCWYNPEGKTCPENMSLTYVAKSFDEVIKYITGEES